MGNFCFFHHALPKMFQKIIEPEIFDPGSRLDHRKEEFLQVDFIHIHFLDEKNEHFSPLFMRYV